MRSVIARDARHGQLLVEHNRVGQIQSTGINKHGRTRLDLIDVLTGEHYAATFARVGEFVSVEDVYTVDVLSTFGLDGTVTVKMARLNQGRPKYRWWVTDAHDQPLGWGDIELLMVHREPNTAAMVQVLNQLENWQPDRRQELAEWAQRCRAPISALADEVRAHIRAVAT